MVTFIISFVNHMAFHTIRRNKLYLLSEEEQAEAEEQQHLLRGSFVWGSEGAGRRDFRIEDGKVNWGVERKDWGDKAPLCLFSKYTFSPTLEIQRENICLHNCWVAIKPSHLFILSLWTTFISAEQFSYTRLHVCSNTEVTEFGTDVYRWLYVFLFNTVPELHVHVSVYLRTQF